MKNGAEFTGFKDGITTVVTQFDDMNVMITSYNDLIDSIDLPGKKPMMMLCLYIGVFVLIGIVV